MKQFSSIILPLLLLCIHFKGIAQDCQCDHTITPDNTYIDGETMDIRPGDVICIKAGKYKFLNLFNFSGTADKPLTFINCGGQVVIGGNQHYYGLLLNNVNYFRFTGTGSSGTKYGFKIDGINSSGSGVAGYGTYGEIDHLEISRTGFAGILYKHDPSCDPTSWRRNYVMKNIAIHDNYIHDTEGEGIYVGYTGGDKTLTCNGKKTTVQPHNIEGLSIYNNKIENTGWDGLQVSRATKDCEIYNNTIKNFGTAREKYQDEGILIGGGTTGRLYNNTIIKGTGVGIQVFGSGNNYIYNNVIADVEADGIFCDDRETVPGRGFYFINNTIVNAGDAGMRMYSTESKGNVFYNNIIANAGKDFVLLNAPIDWKASNNTIVDKVSEAGFVDAGSHDYKLRSNASSVDKGKDVSSYGIRTDHDRKARPAGNAFDVGAYESGASATNNEEPTVNAGSDKSLTLPTNKATITATADDTDGDISKYAWSQVSGPSTASFSGASTKSLTASNLTEGAYIFKITVTDNKSATAEDQVKVTVASESGDGGGTTGGSNGLTYAYYEGNWNKLPNFSSMNAEKTGNISNFSLSPRNTDTYYGFAYNGYIDIQRSGSYTFYTASDDGSALYIDGQKIVDNDGTHSKRERSGSISLSKGMHEIKVVYFDKWGNNDILEVRYSGPGISKSLVPDHVLYTAKGQSNEEPNEPEEPVNSTPPARTSAAIMINFNELSENNASGWNNTNFAPEANKQKSGLKDAENNTTGISVKLLSGWNSSNDKGYSTGDNSARYPDKVIRSYFYTTGQEEVLISGLDEDKTYNFSFFASSWFGGNRTAEYSIGSQKTSLNASYNKDDIATLKSISPNSNGEVTIKVRRASGASYAFLGALIIEPNSSARTAANLKNKQPETMAEEQPITAETVPFKVVAYPNPTEDMLYLAVDGHGELPEGINITLLDMHGHTIDLTRQLQYKGNYISINTNRLGLPAGIYVLQCSALDGNSSSIRIIKK